MTAEDRKSQKKPGDRDKRDEDDVDESLEETFPASDPPSYMPPEKSKD